MRSNLGGNLEASSELPDEFVCVDYTYELLGVAGNTGGDVPFPSVGPVDKDNTQGNVTRFFDPNAACGLGPRDGKPDTGTEYRSAYLSYEAIPGTMDENTNPVGGMFTDGHNVVEGTHQESNDALDIIWR